MKSLKARFSNKQPSIPREAVDDQAILAKDKRAQVHCKLSVQNQIPRISLVGLCTGPAARHETTLRDATRIPTI